MVGTGGTVGGVGETEKGNIVGGGTGVGLAVYINRGRRVGV